MAAHADRPTGVLHRPDGESSPKTAGVNESRFESGSVHIEVKERAEARDFGKDDE